MFKNSRPAIAVAIVGLLLVFFTIQRIWNVLVRCLFLRSAHAFFGFLTAFWSHWNSKGSKKSSRFEAWLFSKYLKSVVRNWCLNDWAVFVERFKFEVRQFERFQFFSIVTLTSVFKVSSPSVLSRRYICILIVPICLRLISLRSS